MQARRYKWFGHGDLNAFATMVFDTLTGITTIAFLLTGIFKMPLNIVLQYFAPGLAVGVVFGSLAYVFLTFRLVKKSGKLDITAFPQGLDAPSCIGLTLSIVGPSFLSFKASGMTPEVAAIHSWYIGCACTFFIGFIKVIFSTFATKLKNMLPTVALLGGLAGVAIGLIAFFPLIFLLQLPLISFFVLALIIMVYFAGYKMPGNMPAVLAAVIFGVVGYHIFQLWLTGSAQIPQLSSIHISAPILNTHLFGAIPAAAKYFAIALPFAFLVILGAISVVESARVMGDNYSTQEILFWDGIATMAMGLFGGTAQTTPYAGYPAYKKMEARTGFLIMNILLIGASSYFGLINYIVALVPAAILAPVLMFIGIEISMQVFLISDKKYFAAAIIGLFPSIAHLLQIELSRGDIVNIDKLTTMITTVTNGQLTDIGAIVCLGNGFIITGVLWATVVYYLVEHKIVAATLTSLTLAILSLFGIIHSIHLDGSMYWIFDLPHAQQIIPLEFAGGYVIFALVAVILHSLQYKKA